MRLWGGWGGGARGAGAGGGAGGGSRSVSSMHVDRKVPLVQAIYDELKTMRDPIAHAQAGEDSPVISKILQMMEGLEPHDLGLVERDFQALRHPLCLPVLESESEQGFEMTVFILPKGGGIPLHDHPNMSVLSRILFGSLEVDSYDEVVGGGGASAGFHAAAAGGVGRCLGARLGQRRLVGPGTGPFLLTPTEGNVHAFRAPTACAVFDVLIPPYDDACGRKCSYFQVELPPQLGGYSQPQPISGSTNGWPRGADEEGATDRSRGVILREIPEPEGLPRWDTYRGPRVIL